MYMEASCLQPGSERPYEADALVHMFGTISLFQEDNTGDQKNSIIKHH